MSVISIFESEVSCLSSILDLGKLCKSTKTSFSDETNRFLLYLTVKKVGPSVAQKVVSKLVEKGEITWEEDEFEVEQILDYNEDDGVEFYLIKWFGWSHAHNSWEPKDNLDCHNLIHEFHGRNTLGRAFRTGMKRKFDEIKVTEEDREIKRTRVNELFHKLATCKERMTPQRLISLTSPDKRRAKPFKGVVSCEGLRVPKFNYTSSGQLLNPRTKAYKVKKVEIKKALKDWEKHLNQVNTDPGAIVVENSVDLEGPPENFVYINDYRSGPGIEIPNDPIIGCECEDCYTEKNGCCAVQFGVEFAYYKNKKLRLTSGRPVYECNKRCRCGPDCLNRVVQHGRKHKVCVFRTANGRGWGVKAMQRISAGSFVIEYVGEVISSEEAELRGMTYDSVGRTYLFDLDFNGDDCPFTVDAAIYGNVSHFVNHSCDPNLEVYSVWINTLDPRLPRIALFSRRIIEKGEELTFDYMSSKVHSAMAECVNVTKSPVDSAEPATMMPPAVTLNGDCLVTDARPTLSDGDEAGNTISPAEKPETADCIDENANETSAAVVNDSGETKEASIDVDSVVNVSEQSTLQEESTLPVVTAAGDAASPVMKPSPRKSPKPATEVYRMVCQCGAKNCRKYVF